MVDWMLSKRTMNHAAVILAFCFSVACKQLMQVSKTAYIIGNNDIVRLDENEVPKDVIRTADSSVLIATTIDKKKRKFCTGTLIKSPDTSNILSVLTNHHCFANVDDNGNVSKELLPDACVSTEVFLGFRVGETQSASSVGCLTGSLRTDSNGDLAVFKLAAQIPARFQPLNLWTNGDVPTGREALIIHYPDVDENFMQVSGSRNKLPVASITETDCLTQGNFPESEWKFDPTLPFSMKHSCDLLHGSSGSALIDKETRTILGVNWGGIKIDYKKSVNTINVATRVDYVKAFLEGNSKEWQSTGAALSSNPGTNGQSDASTATKQRSERSTKNGSGVISCGSISSMKPLNGITSNAVILLLLIPLIVTVIPRRS